MLAALARSQSPGSEATISSPGAAFLISSANPWARFWPVMLPERPSITRTGPLASLPSCSATQSAPWRPACDVVRADREGDLDARLLGDGVVEIGVEIDHRNARVGRLLEAGQEVGRVDRRGDHDRGLALEHGVADVELRLGGLVGLDRLQVVLDARLLGAVLDALLHRAPERVGQRLQQHAVDLLILGARRGRPDQGGAREERRADRHPVHLYLPFVRLDAGLRKGRPDRPERRACGEA